ncbi:MAG: metallophosphoesterase family protein [Polyangia bacterium]
MRPRVGALLGTGLGLLGLLGAARAVESPPPRSPGAGLPGAARPQPGPAGPARAALRFTIEPYLQDVRPDGIVVSWATDVPSTGVVRVDRASVRASFVAETAATHHRVRVTGLAAGQRYGYVVAVRRAGDVGPAASSELVSAPAEFATAPLTDSPFLFLVYGDNRDRDADHLAVIRAMQPEQPDLIVQTGDMVSRAGDEGQWRRYFAAAAPLLRSVPMFPALGNHELRGDPDAGRFFRFFGLPTVVPPLGQAPPGQGLTGLSGLAGLTDLAAPGTAAEPPARRRRPVYYAFRYSNSLFIALDGNSPYDGDQAAWLERTLGEAQHDQSVRHLFVFVHQPPYAVGAYCGSERLQRRIVPLLQRAARGPRPLLRAVFAGHEHAYQHLERGGVRYFITGGGGAPLYPRSQSCDREDDLALRLFRAEHHYLRIQVDGQAATLLALSRSGEVMERVLLHEPVVRDEEPLASLPTETPTLRPGQPGPPGGAAGRERTSGPILLLWVSAIATLSGLLLLTRPSRRRDLSPSSRRYRDDDEG